jgi:hypothetical protein
MKLPPSLQSKIEAVASSRTRAAKPALLAFLLTAAAASYPQTKPNTPPQTNPIQIVSATPNATEAPVFGRIDIAIDLQATFSNPYDPSQVTLDAHITPPTGTAYDLPGFYQESPQTPWHIRLALTEPGVTKVVISAKDKTGTSQSKEIDLTATAATNHGFVKASERDFHFFELTDGAVFFPIGATLQVHKIDDLQTWLPALTSSGANTARIMLGPDNSPFALNTKQSGATKIDQHNAVQLDQALDLMDKQGIHSILVLDNFNELRQRDYDPHWTTNPYNRDNGGPLNTDTEFWKSDAADILYLAKLRYVVARYSAYTNILGWELWRDIDLVHGYDPEVIRPWMDRHTQLLKAMDPYAHLVTVSYADPIGERSIDHLPGIDFVQSHVYNSSDLVPPTTLQQYRKAGYGKPHIVTEVAADFAADHGKQDTNGLQVHDPLWASICSGAAGAAMPWWWDSYVFPKRMYNRFTPVANFVKGIDWPSQNFRPTSPVFRYQTPPTEPIYHDLLLDNGPVSFGNTEYNLPRHVRIWPTYVQYGLPVSGVLQGEKLHQSKFNPVTFTMDIKRSTQFDLIVGDVSGLGGASIQIKLDGEVVMGLDLADPNGLQDDTVITKYRGTYSLHIPAGHHELVVADVGNDWVMASYRFRDLFPRKTPPLIGYCLAGDSVAVAWVRNADRTWDRMENQKRSVTTCPVSTMILQNLIVGSWRAELWDTWTGKVLKTIKVTVGSDGMGAVNLPEIQADIAVKLTKTTAAVKPKVPAKKQ